MIIVPPDLLTRFESILTQRSVPVQLRNYYKKWLRFYLDFCQKYNHPTATEESLQQFIKKLQEKNQTTEQRKQASDAISLYFDLLQKEAVVEATVNSSAPRHENPGLPIVDHERHPLISPSKDGAVIAETSNKPPDLEAPLISEEPEKKIPLQQMPRTADSKDIPTPAVAGWKKAHADLCAEIKVRHYSPKTLKSYALWAKKFQGFTRNKDPQSLLSTDVKEFMKYLAVTQKVSASTQNQGFNALLFLFKHILKKDFGDHTATVRAKRRPYIPVVLSREEIEAILRNLSYPFNPTTTSNH